MRFHVVHAATVPEDTLGIWFLNEHSASFTAMAMTEEKWNAHAPWRSAADALQWQTGPRWGVVAVDEAKEQP